MTAPDRVARTLIKTPCQTGASTYDNALMAHAEKPSGPGNAIERAPDLVSWAKSGAVLWAWGGHQAEMN